MNQWINQLMSNRVVCRASLGWEMGAMESIKGDPHSWWPMMTHTKRELGGRPQDPLCLKTMWTNKKKKRKKLFRCGDFTPFMSRSFQIWDHFFPLLCPKDSENLSLDIGLWELGAKKPLNEVRNTDTKKILLSKANLPRNICFFARRCYTLY